ncbi:hypothetical protein FHS16_005595 [Paenibacillus endophyticus]|uniref:Uncharacterized protein n=1 Tax=Paenibacillus endophyticus TaxID=1294268 RepID=A0A7W5GDV3_9BACL|nr:hypothetical protein [Paenibacillus endophyticus]MBB3155487.1 hypothetical protein [Paenibacillus endophyticus]
MKRIFTLVFAIVFLLGMVSQAHAQGGVNLFNPYPSSTSAPVPDYIGFTLAAGSYQYQVRVTQTNAGNITYNSGKLYVSSNKYEMRHTLPYSLKSTLSQGTFYILVECFNLSGTKIGSDSTTVTFQ